MRYIKNGKNIEISFLTERDLLDPSFIEFVNSDEYRSFMHVDDSVDLYAQRMDRFNYYKSLYAFKILGVKIDGRFVGQSCAFQTIAVVNNERKEWWWGIDTYLFSECRGLGIGKVLQKILHESLPNFSSAWYTPINGIIKRKLGAHAIFDIWFNYYPVSSAVTVFLDLCCRKLLKRSFPIRLSLPFFYAKLNTLFVDSCLRNYQISEVTYDLLGKEESVFMENALKSKNFHIERSEHFLKWRYKNLKENYHMLRIEKYGKLEAIVSFSEIYNSKFDVVPIKCVTIYDMVIAPTSQLSEKQVFLYIIFWYKERKLNFDGVQMLGQIHYFGKIYYPFHACSVLSTLSGKYSDCYLTFADQDMDQI